MQWPNGPDPLFPYLPENVYYKFPDPAKALGAIVCVGGNLSPGMLISAYKQGIFPWFNEGEPLTWCSPDPRFVIFPQNLHISASMRKVFKKKTFEISFDRAFDAVISSCASIKRPGEDGTWITHDMINAYNELHRLGKAHSAEAWHNGRLSGGCYGLRLGAVFSGESMFAREANASKAAFLTLAGSLFSQGVAFIDCQLYTPHLASLGGTEISRAEFLTLLKRHID
ncbi:MAG: leucyl/phenylalanyl-tRNA--protein transferase [Spirochaetaceae bacterium]|nr:leucyl/phenylalanyl-tRNA--protein transferase [Spirochaetaceae bacterium]